ncbi:hypothetical protein ABPG74_017047 [Tetrahymena malaccensis]
MPNYPIFYSIQNDKDSSTNVFSLNFNDQVQGDEVLKLRHIINEFPIDLLSGSYHIRFKIQCNETEPKIFAWIDPQNLEARAPIINNAVYVKILQLTKDGDSKIYNKQKIVKIKQKGSLGSQPAKEQKKPSPASRTENVPKLKEQKGSSTNIHHSSSDPDLVHKEHMKSTNLFDDEYKDTQKSSQFKLKSSSNLDAQQQKLENSQTKKTIVKNHLDDDEDHDIPAPQASSVQPSQAPPSGINFFDSDDEGAPPSGTGKNSSLPNNASSNNIDLFPSDDNSNRAFKAHEALIDHHKGPVSEFDRKLESRKNEYIINGEIDRKKLIEVKDKILKEEQEERKREYEEEQRKKAQEQIDKRSAQERLEGKIKSWKEQNGTRKDIRTLLSTLQNILWPGANWNPVSFFDLSTEESLKSAIKKVLITFHPDRNRNDIEKKYICEQIIDEIRKAQKEYESKQQK